jgi:hypothetical protein
MDIQVQDTQAPKKICLKETVLRYITFELSKLQGEQKFLKTAREEHQAYLFEPQ